MNQTFITVKFEFLNVVCMFWPKSKARAVITIKYKNYLRRSPCDFLNDDLNAPSSPILQAQTWSFSPFSGMGQVNSWVWSSLVQRVVVVGIVEEDTVANPRRRTKNGRNIFQVLKMVLCRIFPTEKTNGHYEIPDGSELRKGKWNRFQLSGCSAQLA